MRKEEIWSLPLSRVRAFFEAEPEVSAQTADLYFFHSCRITLDGLPPRGEGIWAAPRVRICMEGEEADVQRIHRRFFLQFLSTGG